MLHLIFDFDGVIGDTQEATDAATALADNTDIETARRVNREYVSTKPNHTRNHTLTDTELQELFDWNLQFGAYMQSSEFRFFDKFVSEIEKLPTAHKAVVSSGSILYVEPAMKRTNIQPTHVLAYEDHHSKEEKIELICRDWGVDVSQVYYFTDTLADIYELRDLIAPEKLIAVSWGYCTREQLLSELPPEQVLDTPDQLSVLLKY